MKWIGKVLLVYLVTAFLSLMLNEIGLNLGIYRPYNSDGQSVFAYLWFIPTTIVSFYICLNKGSSSKTFISIGFIVVSLYITQFLFYLFLKPSLISYVDFYDATWKYTRDKIVIKYIDFPIQPWLFGAFFGYLLGSLKEYFKTERKTKLN